MIRSVATAALVVAFVAACNAEPVAVPAVPRVLDVSLAPAEATVTTPLVATGVGFDPLGAPIDLTFAWEATDAAGITRTLERTRTPTLESGHRKGDRVRVVVSADTSSGPVSAYIYVLATDPEFSPSSGR